MEAASPVGTTVEVAAVVVDPAVDPGGLNCTPAKFAKAIADVTAATPKDVCRRQMRSKMCEERKALDSKIAQSNGLQLDDVR